MIFEHACQYGTLLTGAYKRIEACFPATLIDVIRSRQFEDYVLGGG